MEGAHAEGHICDGSVLGLFVFKLNTSGLSVLITRHEKDSTLSNLLQQVAWRKSCLVIQVGKGWHFAVDELQFQRSDLKLEEKTLCLQIDQALVLLNASQLPVFVGEVGRSLLEQGHWCETARLKLNLVRVLVVLEFLFIATNELS